MCAGTTAEAKKTLCIVMEKSAKSEMRKYVAGCFCFQQTPKKKGFGSMAQK
jgi:hypothetical protein